MVPLAQEEWESALAQKLKLWYLTRQLCRAFVDLLAKHSLFSATHHFSQNVPAVTFLNWIELQVLQFTDGFFVW